MYIAGVSLGGSLASLYLIEEDGRHPYSGAIITGAPFDAVQSIPKFCKRLFGVLNSNLGASPKATLKQIYPVIAKYSTEQ